MANLTFIAAFCIGDTCLIGWTRFDWLTVGSFDLARFQWITNLFGLVLRSLAFTIAIQRAFHHPVLFVWPCLSHLVFTIAILDFVAKLDAATQPINILGSLECCSVSNFDCFERNGHLPPRLQFVFCVSYPNFWLDHVLCCMASVRRGIFGVRHFKWNLSRGLVLLAFDRRYLAL